MITGIRRLLYPFSLLYGVITKIRNNLYDRGLFVSNEFDIPIINVGNLRVGGTGKTPQIAYLVKLLKSDYKVAVLSRGYKRKTKGFIFATDRSTVFEIGDEPYQLYKQHPDIFVAVDTDRTQGIRSLLSLENPPDLILLDDAFQHRKVKAGLNILLTPYHDLYVDDVQLPTGNLRESIDGAMRAQIIVVTKCPERLTEQQENIIFQKLRPEQEQKIFFTKIKYADFVQNDIDRISVRDLQDYGVILVTGIANPIHLLNFLEFNNIAVTHISFSDHHNFSKSDINNIRESFNKLQNKKRIILTTEKDYVRIFGGLENLYFLAIETVFINHQNDFDKIILDYVGQNARDSKIS